MGRVTDHERIRRSQSFDARSNVRDVTQGQLFLSSGAPHLPNYDQPRMNPQPNTELNTFGLLQTLIQVSQSSKHAEPRPYRTLGVIFMGLGIAKVHEESIP